jgi:DNA-binding beta-propeller fold protein YncE
MQDSSTEKASSKSWLCLHTFTGYRCWVYGVPITPDGKIIVTHDCEEIIVSDLGSGEVINVLTGHSDLVFSLAINPEGNILASGSLDKTVKIWDLGKGELIYTLSERADPIYSVAFSPDGNLVASGGSSRYKSIHDRLTTIYLWNSKTGELVDKLIGHSKRIDSLAFSPNGNIIASHSYDQTIKIWNLNTREIIYTISLDSEGCKTVAITPDGNNLVSTDENNIKIWNLATGSLLRTIYSEYVRSFTISPNGKLITTCSPNVTVWNFDTGEPIQQLDLPQRVTVGFSPNGQMLATGSAHAYENENGVEARVTVLQVPQELWGENTDKTQEVTSLQGKLDRDGYFNPENIKDARERINTSIAKRKGQPKFRGELIAAYQSRCAITGFNAEQALEAAHIYPFKGDDTNKVWNGLLLRADIHTLFDLHLITIHPETKEIVIAPELKNTSYGELQGKNLCLPKDNNLCPKKEVLEWHYKQCKWT